MCPSGGDETVCVVAAGENGTDVDVGDDKVYTGRSSECTDTVGWGFEDAGMWVNDLAVLDGPVVSRVPLCVV